jgi:hypothetical protein
VRGAAWSLPVVAVAAHAPAFASSTNAPRPSVTVCKETAGSKCYRFALSIQAPSQDWTITLTSLVVTNDTTPVGGEELIAQTSPKDLAVTTTGANLFQVQACTTGNLASWAAVTLKYTATTTGMPSENVTVSYNFPGIDPCK